ncbi:hypothetical protein [Paenibacillus chitinolyticus]|uniref:GNAT family N-acetyltransferase n=1 Tax=Paenibacillus chitinolyticus TaxID=79263 RepID=A0ABT4FC46_9BACL|nr:hypothetical protein [Paenibacillus chitinolyticus]MCY9591545.1 hypothetical protein [Paenibacillus chitinolyticus]MCY9594622.1 hypothetical protein [Paenibacillus chitinolyticus]
MLSIHLERQALDALAFYQLRIEDDMVAHIPAFQQICEELRGLIAGLVFVLVDGRKGWRGVRF